jgi:citrate synthase
MRIGKQDQPFTAICTSTADTITVRGLDLCSEIIGEFGFTEYFYFLVTGKRPDDTQRKLTDAVLASIAEHGLVPTVQAARMTLTAAPDAFQGAVAAGILGCGSVVAGSSEVAGRFLVSLLDEVGDGDADEIVKARLEEMRAARKPVPGYGHPQHSEGDPRAHRLIELAEKHDASGRHIEMLQRVERIIPEFWGRRLPINVSGAIPAVMLDIGFPVGALKGLPILARTASLIAHLHEEFERPIGFIMSHHADLAIEYDGEPASSAAAE